MGILDFGKTPGASKPLVLLIDDCEDQLAVFEIYLKNNNFDVITASSAEEGFRVLNDIHVDCVVSDVFMPQISGKDFVSFVRQVKGQRKLPVITFSAAEEDMSDELVKAGADAFVPKKDARRRLVPQIEKLLIDNINTENLLDSIQGRF